MITAKFKLEWEGNAYNQRLHRNLVQAVAKSAMLVQRSTKELLNTSGKSQTAKSGINQIGSRNGTTAVNSRFNAGLRDIFNIKQVSTTKGKPKTLTFGGTLASSKTGQLNRVYWYGEPLHRWVQASQPGTPPHKQTGTLQRSIVFQTMDGGLKAKIGPGENLIYGRIQELGGQSLVKLPARPYLRPAFEANQQAILFQFALAVQKAAK